jgi:hypothetical protein
MRDTTAPPLSSLGGRRARPGVLLLPQASGSLATAAEAAPRKLDVREHLRKPQKQRDRPSSRVKIASSRFEALAREATWILEDANGDSADVRDGDLRELSRWRERRGVDALRELLFAEMEVLHEIDGRQDRGAYADLGDVLFDLVLAVEVRDARLSIGGAGRGEDEVYNRP